MREQAVLDVDGVSKSYDGRLALDDVSLTVGAGEVCGLLGPNGAGKTTLVSIVAGLRRADAGRVRVAGLDVASGSRAAREAVGLAAQETAVYPTISVRENLDLFARLAGLRGAAVAARIEEVADVVELTELLDRRARTLSGGEKRRLHTAMALVHRPRLLLLDEPTTGVDIATRARLLHAISTLAAEEGCAVLYSTHYLPEVEELDASVAVIDRGRLLARGPLAELVAEHGRGHVELLFDGPAPDPAAFGDVAASVDGSVVGVACEQPAAQVPGLLARLGADAERLVAVELARPSLETVFLAITGRTYRSDDDDLDVGTIPATDPGAELDPTTEVVQP